jgi:ATP-dependent helicase HrpB
VIDSSPGDLPIAPLLPEIARRIQESGALVLAAEPGAGKTSLVPPALAEAELAASRRSGRRPGKILVVEPRRVAAVAAAARIAEVSGKKLGDDVGYRVRGESRSGPRSCIEVVTPGVLVRMLQSDPGLDDASCVVLDEFHERSAQTDLALALLAQSRELRRGGGSELRLLAMSATIDAARTASALGAELLEVPGRSFPIETRYANLVVERGFEAELARRAFELMGETAGDVLVFLPGAAEIARAAEAFTALAAPSRASARPEAVVLHGSLALEAQRRILSPPPNSPRRAIFATSIAETSLTVPRVRAVLDSGLARLSRFHPPTGLNRLVTEREARDRADQRRGRSGRLGPGICLRAWSATEALAERTEPELSRAELSGIVLEAALWGAPRRLDLPWLDPPPEGAWASGTELLIGLGALDASLSPTPFGRRMAALGTESRLGALVLRGADAGEGWTACLAAAILSERGGAGCNDLAERIEGLGRGMRDDGIIAEANRLARAISARPGGRTKPSALSPLLAAAFPDRIGELVERSGGRASYRIPAGRVLRATAPLSASDWIVALEADAGAAEGRVYSGHALSETDARAVLEAQATEGIELEWRGLELKAAAVSRAGAIVLARRPAERPGREELALLLARRVASEGLAILPWGGAAAEELARLRFFATARPEEARRCGFEPSSLDDAALAARIEAWLGPFLLEGKGAVVDGAALEKAVAALAPRSLRSTLEREAPRRIELPSGSSRPIDYGSIGGPSVEARVQEFFGLAEHPKVCGRPLVLHLLDPGGKPLQVTSDAPGFWAGSWVEARKELKGRYPKHEWPENPALAAPSRSGIKRRPGGTYSGRERG